uniref:Secretion protein HlyD family protein n=1 Tax=Aetherobacter rufus TaxID=888831 RepID=A0A3S7UUX3_9BACT|nr:secretion protein HlyD family protein [Aetherobacter rufus]
MDQPDAVAARRKIGEEPRRALRLGLAAVSLLLAASPLGCERAAAGTAAPTPSASAEAKAPPRVEIDPALIDQGRVRLGRASSRSLAAEQVLAGDVVPSEDGEADVGALVSGRIATIDVAEGARVSKGQVLARIDAPDVGRATAELLRARGRGEATARKLARQLELAKQGATSPNAIDEARAEDRAARAELTAARTMLATLGAAEPRADEDTSAPTTSRAVSIRIAIKAPIAGVVVQRSAVLGGAVTPDRSLFHLIDPARLLVRAKLPETAGALPVAGARASIRPRAAGGQGSTERCEATVIEGFGAVDEITRTVPFRLRPAGGCAWLLPGAYVDALLERGAPSTDPAAAPASVVVPTEAVIDVRGVPTVFVAGERPGVFLPQPVRVGPVMGASILVEAGLADGASIVIAGGVLLKGELLRSALGGD